MNDLAPGGRLGKYEVRGTLGKGAMGTVHDGWDPVIDRRVAIKTVRLPEANDPEAQEGLARFKREAQAAGRLNHPNIVGVFDYGETDDLAFIVMEFVDGRTLKELLEGDERLPLSETMRLMGDILAGLTYSHERGVVHRDIKPANIMLTRQGQAKIADFGIARIESSSMTQAGTVLGTPAYMSPEQFMGQTVDRRTDIYSSGVLLYQLLTGERPFEGGLTAIMHKVLNTVPPRPSELSVTAPSALDPVVARAMARRPADRFDDAAAFALALREGGLPSSPEPASDATIVSAPSIPRPASKPVAAAPAQRASRLPAMAAGGLALVAVAGGAAWFLARPAPSPTLTASIATPQAPSAAAPQPVTPPPPEPQAAQAPAPAPAKTEPQPALSPPPAPPAALASLPSTPASSVAPAAPPARPPAAIRAALAAALPGLSCTLASADVSESGAATITGLAGVGVPETALRRTVEAASPATTNLLHLATFDGPYCRALDVLRPIAARGASGGNRLELAFADGRSMLHDNEVIALGVAMPDFAGHLEVDYLQHDGTVAHLAPGAGNPDRTYAAGAHAELGRPRPDFDGWKVGPPFGTDMIVVIASTAPLFARARPDGEPIDGYLHDLQAAMDGLRRRGGNLAADAVVLDTRP